MIVSHVVLGIGLTALGSAGCAAVFVGRRRRNERRTARRLARGLGLDGAERRAVEQLARAAGLGSAGPLLLSRGAFDHALRGRPVHDPRRAAWGGLRHRLFDVHSGP